MISTYRRAPLPAKRYHEKRVAPSVRRTPDWEAAGLSGLLGGLAFMALETIFTKMLGGGLWDAPRLIAGVVFGGTLGAAPSLSKLFVLSLFIHFTLSLLYARILSLYLTFRRAGSPALAGAAFGVLLYVVNIHGVGAVLPRLAAAQGWPWLLSHVGFGVAAALTYARLERAAYE